MNIILTDNEDNLLTGFDLSGLTKKQIYKKIYYEKNKEKILLDKATVIVCECGRNFCKQQKARHMKEYWHQLYLLNKLD